MTLQSIQAEFPVNPSGKPPRSLPEKFPASPPGSLPEEFPASPPGSLPEEFPVMPFSVAPEGPGPRSPTPKPTFPEACRAYCPILFPHGMTRPAPLEKVDTWHL